MKKNKLLLLLLLTSRFACGQFAEIVSKRGYVVPNWDKNSHNCSDTLFNKEIVYIIWPENNRMKIVSSHKACRAELRDSNYIFIDKTYTMFNRIILRNKAISFTLNDMQIKIKIDKFKPKKHVIDYGPDSLSTFIENIDGSEPFGNPTNPHWHYKYIKVKLDGITLNLPIIALGNLFEPNLSFTECYYDKASSKLFIIAQNSDGGEFYNVLWLIERGKYIKRVICNGN